MATPERTLLIDLGNSSLKWAWLQAGGLGPIERAPYVNIGGEPGFSPDCLPAQPEPERVLISAVAAPELVKAVQSWVFNQWGLEPEILKAEASALGVTSGYDNPSQLGVDRWIALVAAHHAVQGPACVVDCGTAITIDVIAGDGQHLGGLILPGIGLMREALKNDTAIPWVEKGNREELFAADTGSAVAAGGLNAAVALVEKVMVRSTERLGERPVLLLTGGDAEQLLGVLREPARSEPDLVMEGMALIADAR
jgi:type III pantothenate kinase